MAEEKIPVREAHVLEMVGYCDHRPGTQAIPPGLPIQIPDCGDFLGILANQASTAMAKSVCKQPGPYWPDFPVLSLKVYDGRGETPPRSATKRPRSLLGGRHSRHHVDR